MSLEEVKVHIDEAKKFLSKNPELTSNGTVEIVMRAQQRKESIPKILQDNLKKVEVLRRNLNASTAELIETSNGEVPPVLAESNRCSEDLELIDKLYGKSKARLTYNGTLATGSFSPTTLAKERLIQLQGYLALRSALVHQDFVYDEKAPKNERAQTRKSDPWIVTDALLVTFSTTDANTLPPSQDMGWVRTDLTNNILLKIAEDNDFTINGDRHAAGAIRRNYRIKETADRKAKKHEASRPSTGSIVLIAEKRSHALSRREQPYFFDHKIEYGNIDITQKNSDALLANVRQTIHAQVMGAADLIANFIAAEIRGISNPTFNPELVRGRKGINPSRLLQRYRVLA